MTNEVKQKAKRTKWTKEKCTEVAQKYTNKSVFHKQDQSAYQAARRLGVLEEICSHMKEEKRGRKPKTVQVVTEPTVAETPATEVVSEQEPTVVC
jgi:hypothetical protein